MAAMPLMAMVGMLPMAETLPTVEPQLLELTPLPPLLQRLQLLTDNKAVSSKVANSKVELWLLGRTLLLELRKPLLPLTGNKAASSRVANKPLQLKPLKWPRLQPPQPHKVPIRIKLMLKPVETINLAASVTSVDDAGKASGVPAATDSRADPMSCK